MDEFEQALARGLREDAAVVPLSVPAPRGRGLARWCIVAGLLVAAGVVLYAGFVLAARVLPPIADAFSALMWAPLGFAGLVVLAVAREVVRAVQP